jgi:hypothetical protein
VADLSKSIVNAEYAAARELRIPVFTFVKRDVLDDHRIYQRNKANEILDQIEFPSVEKQNLAGRIFQFIDDVRLAPTNNGFFSFEYSRDIETLLRKQWAGLMFDLLQRRQLSEQYEHQNKVLSALTATTGQLEDLVKRLYRRADGSAADAVIAQLEHKSKAEQFFRDLFSQFEAEGGFLKTTLDELLALPVKQTWVEWVVSTKDFGLKVQEAEGYRVSYVVSIESNVGVFVEAPKLPSRWWKIVSELQELFDAFMRLEQTQKREVLGPFVTSPSRDYREIESA